MKEKLGIAFIIVIASFCLFGCGEEMPEEEMVIQTHLSENIS